MGFPILRHHIKRRPIKSIPIEWLSEEMAIKNHSQSLKRLAERGGLSPIEAMANIMNCHPYDLKMTEDRCDEWFANLIGYNIVSREQVYEMMGVENKQ